MKDDRRERKRREGQWEGVNQRDELKTRFNAKGMSGRRSKQEGVEVPKCLETRKVRWMDGRNPLLKSGDPVCPLG